MALQSRSLYAKERRRSIGVARCIPGHLAIRLRRVFERSGSASWSLNSSCAVCFTVLEQSPMIARLVDRGLEFVAQLRQSLESLLVGEVLVQGDFPVIVYGFEGVVCQ
jgi:hypothetical protein